MLRDGTGGLIPWLLVGLLGVTAAAPSQILQAAGPDPTSGLLRPGDRGFEVELEDQYGDRVVYPLPEERLNLDGSAPVTLVVWAGRGGADARRGWIRSLRARYAEALDRESRPGLVVLAVAHLPDVPGLLRGFILRRHFEDRPPVGLDWDQTVARQLGFEPSTTNLAVLDPEGRLAARLSGDPTEPNQRRLFRVLDPLLSPASPDPETIRRWLRWWSGVPWPPGGPIRPSSPP